MKTQYTQWKKKQAIEKETAHLRFEVLTATEITIIEHRKKGFTYKQIGESLNMTGANVQSRYKKMLDPNGKHYYRSMSLYIAESSEKIPSVCHLTKEDLTAYAQKQVSLSTLSVKYKVKLKDMKKELITLTKLYHFRRRDKRKDKLIY